MVPPTITIGTGFKIPHAVGVILGETTEIGKNCTIFPNAMIIARHSPHFKNPTGRRHAKIGDNCVIAANSLIIKDVPDNTVMVAPPAYKLKDI